MKANEELDSQKITILVVDDEESLTFTVSEVLRLHGYVVVSALSGEEGWREFKRVQPDLVITDLHMEEGNGLDLLTKIKAENSLTPVIVLTGFASLESAIIAFRLGVSDFLVKPCIVDDMLQVIERALKSSNTSMVAVNENLAAFLNQENRNARRPFVQIASTKNSAQTDQDVDIYKSLCANVAHDLRGEFFHIWKSIKDIRETVGESTEVQEDCDIIERSLNRSQLLLQNLINYVQIGEPQIESIGIAELVRRIESLIRPRLASSIQLAIFVDPKARKQQVSVDIGQLLGVLLELINNAAQVLREKGGNISIKIYKPEIEETRLDESVNDLNVAIKNDKIAIRVTDSGPGIPKELQGKLMEEPVVSKSGSGLGLFLAKKVITIMGGSLKLKSSETGTTFTVFLPITDDKKVS